jgi:hypothetical protein
MQEDSIYLAHGMFVATVTPPMAVAIVLGFLWRRYTAWAAIATLLGGGLAMGIATVYPEVVAPFAHGVDPDGDFKYMRALYGAAVSGAIGVIVTLMTKPVKTDEEIVGLTIGTIRDAERKFKGGEVNRERGGKVKARLIALDAADADAAAKADVGTVHDQPDNEDGPAPPLVSLHPDDLKALAARPGDLIYLADERWWLGGLRAAHARVRDDKGKKGEIALPAAVIDINSLLVKRKVVIEKIM